MQVKLLDYGVPSEMQPTYFCFVLSNGGAYSNSASNSNGVAFGFCV